MNNFTMRRTEEVFESYDSEGPAVEYEGLGAMVVNDVRLMV